MCGIFGKLYFKKHRNEKGMLLGCLEKLNHRGPDDTGTYQDSAIFLGSKRLSIIDRSLQGRMPLSNDDDTLWITFNGEIYNHLELKKLLHKRHHFRSGSDTEVLLHLYEEMGPECLQYIQGMFAFAIWDKNKRELFIARDRLGKKPLLYCLSDTYFIFSSELHALMTDHNVPHLINDGSVYQFFSLGYIPAPNTYYKNVYKLEPATFMVINHNGIVKTKRYWQQSFVPKFDLSFQESSDILLDKLKESIKIRLHFELPVGIHLSGGLDSSLITALASQMVDYPLKTYSVGFEEKKYNELPYAKQISSIYKTNHHEIIVKPQIINELPQIISSFGEPFADPSILPTWELCKATEEKSTVILNGDGGDENFGGYRRYRTNMLKRYFHLIPLKKQFNYFLQICNNKTLSKVGSFLANADRSDFDFYQSQIGTTTEKRADLDPILRNKWNDSLGSVDRLLNFDFQTVLPNCYLAKTDIINMHFGIEARSPFLDYEVVEFVSHLPEEYKISLFNSKIILKSIAKNILPKDCISREKQGFNVPLYSWFIHKKNFIIDSFSTNSDITMFVSKKEIVKLLEDFYSLPENEQRTKRVWFFLVFQLWTLSALKKS